ncbi:MAG: TM0996/MTH895 family glutaredoxin-like protein [Dehalococcoidia bacterium]|nr:TM0996/MTH895 family glutaredoxin-like protein [Dehalococcoidia bacterium]
MEIKILGPGCTRCHQLKQATREAVNELGIDAEIEEVRNIKEITNYPILTTPGLVIDEKLVCSGQIPTKAEITAFITTALTEDSNEIS